MRTINFPSGVVSSHGGVLDLVRHEVGKDLRVRMLVVGVTDATRTCRPVFGRFDIARQEDLKATSVRPKGDVVLVDEQSSVEDFLVRLEPTFIGKPLRAGGVDFHGHYMEAQWEANQHTDDWRDFGAAWPCVVAAPVAETVRQRFFDPLEADGPVAVFDGLDQLVRYVAEIRPTPGYSAQDTRFRRFQLLIWDYRGRIDRCEIDGTSARIAVSPPSTKGLRLSGVVAGATRQKPIAVDAPTDHQIELHEPVNRVRVVLKANDQIVSEEELDLHQEALRRVLDGLPPSTGADQPIAPPPVLHGGSPPIAPPVAPPDSPTNVVIGVAGPTPPPGPPTTAEPTVEASTRLADDIWRPERPLGSGGQGTTTLVLNLARFQRGVLKVMKPREGWTDEQRTKAIARLRREIKTTKDVKHPCVVAVLQDDVEAAEPTVIYEYMPFGPLSDHLKVCKGDVWRSLRLARDVALGLSVLHERKLTHRDIKPSNIFLRDLDHAVVGDLGIVHDPHATELTATTEIVGAHWYRPPEAENGRLEDPPPNFDFYSLGKVIYVMLSGGRRFEREDFRTGDADLCKLLGRSDLEALNVLLDRMIVRDPSKRFQGAIDVIDAIDRTLSALFGRGGSDGRCRACGDGIYVDGGPLQVDTGGFKIAGVPLAIRARVCPKCGNLELVDGATAKAYARGR